METKMIDVNEALLRGVAAGEPAISHESHGEVFYRFPLSVARLSGVEDTVNVIVPARLLLCPIAAGQGVETHGEVRTFNNRSGVGSRLVVAMHARQLEKADGEPVNALRLRGTICRPVVVRRTPLGREICDLMLAVNRRYGRADYLPCIAWGALAEHCGRLGVGDHLAVSGRLQSRQYTKQTDRGAEQRTAFEISIMSLEE